MKTGPDGCDYANEHQSHHFELLHLCGCGDPTASYNFCRDVLTQFDRRGYEFPKGVWLNAEEATKEIVSAHPEAAAHTLLHLLTHLELIEHGGSVGGSWLTKDGEKIVDLSPATDEIMDEHIWDEVT